MPGESAPPSATLYAGNVKMNGEGKSCSFCGVAWAPENRFMGGLGAFICRDCAMRAADILSDEVAYSSANPPAPPWESMSDEELLARLPEILTTSEQVEWFLHSWVGMLRDRGVSWQRIGLALGVSRQAAWERFTRLNRGLTKRAKQG